MRTFTLLLAILVISIVAVAWFKPEVATRAMDRTPPNIELKWPPSSPTTDNNNGVAISIEVADLQSHIATISLRIEQSGRSIDLLDEQNLNAPTFSREIPYSAQALGLKEGEASLIIEASDNAFLKNTSTKRVPFLVDLYSPQIELLTQQHIANQGGAELVIFRVVEKNLKVAGVEVGDFIFPAIAGIKLDSRLSAKDIYATLFAIPLEFQVKNSPINVFAQDSSGNRTTHELNFTVKPASLKPVQSRLSEAFLKKKIPALYRKYCEQAQIIEPIRLESIENYIEAFRLVNEEYRKLLNTKLESIFKRPPTARAWESTFIRPLSASTSSILGEDRSYSLNGIPAGGSIHNGLDLASVEHDSIKSVANGTVVFAKDHGIYGNTIVIDHGFGVMSLYGHLSSFSCKEGDQIKMGQIIGRTGTTGLAGGDHLHFELRIFGTPVRPIEWWDAHWIKDNIEGKIIAAVGTE